MSADSQGNLYFGSANVGSSGAAVMKLTPGGELGVWKDGFTAGIAGVVVDTADGDNIWVVVEKSGQSIFKYTVDGALLFTNTTSTTARRTASRAAQDGTIWVAESNNPSPGGTVEIFSLSRTGVVAGPA
jgi:hypothetical protein